jgi:hypothetical protein
MRWLVAGHAASPEPGLNFVPLTGQLLIASPLLWLCASRQNGGLFCGTDFWTDGITELP